MWLLRFLVLIAWPYNENTIRCVPDVHGRKSHIKVGFRMNLRIPIINATTTCLIVRYFPNSINHLSPGWNVQNWYFLCPRKGLNPHSESFYWGCNFYVHHGRNMQLLVTGMRHNSPNTNHASHCHDNSHGRCCEWSKFQQLSVDGIDQCPTLSMCNAQMPWRYNAELSFVIAF